MFDKTWKPITCIFPAIGNLGSQEPKLPGASILALSTCFQMFYPKVLFYPEYFIQNVLSKNVLSKRFSHVFSKMFCPKSFIQNVFSKMFYPKCFIQKCFIQNILSKTFYQKCFTQNVLSKMLYPKQFIQQISFHSFIFFLSFLSFLSFPLLSFPLLSIIIWIH